MDGPPKERDRQVVLLSQKVIIDRGSYAEGGHHYGLNSKPVDELRSI